MIRTFMPLIMYISPLLLLILISLTGGPIQFLLLLILLPILVVLMFRIKFFITGYLGIVTGEMYENQFRLYHNRKIDIELYKKGLKIQEIGFVPIENLVKLNVRESSLIFTFHCPNTEKIRAIRLKATEIEVNRFVKKYEKYFGVEMKV